ncbi:DNA phosphorothioation system sulfurtransferase DndC [Chryseobacterium carnipullorum]|uniref:DNA phosphorothioation system sulfurtransferase DndC n=1 Tax=Chryseobacterium carnipullorum TaxID=1124835 RepID=A0A376EDQ7_CHRCU|nr:DNA phosphorothioation system sulfurtransferase DndC [Chryseobacterium carnipullorum]AZA47033.1 DNA phosphorothioation system sulfurtransferase DndC [Chryseobacterium carnipullorum]AZA66383.1 DNA phosphorothioation system sulfurtransferase DndC [Chryseobacterium carnipullorum]STD07403.1 PUA domain (predicted RNA-binding domain) [Chryseobacterium carnipullorum]
MAKFIQNIVDEIIDQYLFADKSLRPWIIGFSGGKDSTVMLQFVWKALQHIKQLALVPYREIYIVCNDTMVENPVITEYVYRVLEKIEQAAVEQDLPIRVIKTIPRLEDSFWVNLIGKGYPAPNNAFRWCTERLKIKPTQRFILEQIDEFGEAVILIGTRSAESASRAKSMKKHAIKGKRLSKHPTQPNTFMYAPIRHLSLEEVWYTINTMPSPWGASNEELFQIYSDASADDYECPTVVTDKEHKSCGQSRFGCWTCTVVKQDKSMSALIENGLTWLKPLLQLRNELAEERNIIENRMPQRRNGTDAINGMGPYYPKYRASVLLRLLQAQKEVQKDKPHVELITNQELIAIQTIWYRDFVFDQKVSEIYHNAYKSDLDMKDHNEKKEKELELLKKSCQENPQDFELIQELLTLQKNKSLLNRKRGLKDDIETRIEEYLKKEQKDVH